MRLKKGTKAERVYDERLHTNAIKLTKARGRFTLDEIEEALRYGRDVNGHYMQGNYAITLRCGDSTCGVSGWMDGDGHKEGDTVYCYPIDEDGDCPICKQYVPPQYRCINCGADWRPLASRQLKACEQQVALISGLLGMAEYLNHNAADAPVWSDGHTLLFTNEGLMPSFEAILTAFQIPYEKGSPGQSDFDYWHIVLPWETEEKGDLL